MKKFWLALLGAVVLSTALSLAVPPAFALGGCGENFHRDGNGNCVPGGQNEELEFHCLVAAAWAGLGTDRTGWLRDADPGRPSKAASKPFASRDSALIVS